MRELARGQAARHTALFEELHDVLVTASEPAGSCPRCAEPMLVRKTLVRRAMTLAHGTFRVHETEYVCPVGCRWASGERVSHRPGNLAATLLPDSSVGYDLMVFVGLQRYLHHRQREEIREALERDHGIGISTGEISRLAQLFLDYLERLHEHRHEEIKIALAQDGGYPLHIDATGEDGRGTLLVLYAGWKKWVLGAFKIPTENAAAIRPRIEKVVAWAGLPAAFVRDLGRAMILACNEVVSRVNAPIPVLACHYHFLADVGKDLLARGHGTLRTLFRRFKTRSRLAALVRDLGRALGEDIEHVRREVREWLEDAATARELPAGRQGLGVVRAIAQRCLDYKIENGGLDFPFVLPYLSLYDRCIQARRFLARLETADPADSAVLRARDRLLAILDPVDSQVPFMAAVRDLRQRQALFEELRSALRLVPKTSDPAPAAPSREGSEAELQDIQNALEELRASLQDRRPARGPAQSRREAIDLVLDHLDRHGDSLWGHVIALPEEVGGGSRMVERTNDILENFFRGMKHGSRRRTGRKNLTQDFEAMPATAALAENLRQHDYVVLLCGTLERLPQAFATLDQEHRRARRVGRSSSVGGPSNPRGPANATASLPIEDRRVIRSAAMSERINAGARGGRPTARIKPRQVASGR